MSNILEKLTNLFSRKAGNSPLDLYWREESPFDIKIISLSGQQMRPIARISINNSLGPQARETIMQFLVMNFAASLHAALAGSNGRENPPPTKPGIFLVEKGSRFMAEPSFFPIANARTSDVFIQMDTQAIVPVLSVTLYGRDLLRKEDEILNRLLTELSPQSENPAMAAAPSLEAPR